MNILIDIDLKWIEKNKADDNIKKQKLDNKDKNWKKCLPTENYKNKTKLF